MIPLEQSVALRKRPEVTVPRMLLTGRRRLLTWRRLQLREQELRYALLALSKVLDREVDIASCHGTPRRAMIRQNVDHERRDAADFDERSCTCRADGEAKAGAVSPRPTSCRSAAASPRSDARPHLRCAASAQGGAERAGLLLERARREDPAAVPLREDHAVVATTPLENADAFRAERDRERPLRAALRVGAMQLPRLEIDVLPPHRCPVHAAQTGEQQEHLVVAADAGPRADPLAAEDRTHPTG